MQCSIETTSCIYHNILGRFICEYSLNADKELVLYHFMLFDLLWNQFANQKNLVGYVLYGMENTKTLFHSGKNTDPVRDIFILLAVILIGRMYTIVQQDTFECGRNVEY